MDTGQCKGRWSSGLGFLWLLVGLAALSIVTSIAAYSEPRGALAIEHSVCRSLAPSGEPIGEAEFEILPFSMTARIPDEAAAVQCDFVRDFAAGELSEAALLIPSFGDAIRIEVNGEAVVSAQLHMMRNLRYSSLPAFVPSLQDVVREGRNHFRIVLSALPGHKGTLDRIFIGPQDELKPYYHARWFAAAVLPTVAVGGEIALAIVLALIWIARRHETEFGWLAATLALAAIRGSVMIPDFGLAGPQAPFWNLLVVWEAAAGLMFCTALARAQSPLLRLFAMAPLAVTTLYIIDPGIGMIAMIRYAAMALVALYLGLANVVLVRAALADNRDALIVAPGMIVLSAFVLSDLISILHPGFSQIFLARAAYSSFLLAVTGLMTLRFVKAMRELDSTAEALSVRVSDVEGELRATYEELRTRREAEVLNRERERLMRDLHDGIGGELASMLALTDAPVPRTQEIARHARAALTDMRLIIDSLEDYGGDMSLALVAWRERSQPQLRAAGLRLVWAVGDVPPLEKFGSAQVLDVLRIVQEAVTNVIKHAKASYVRIETSTHPDNIAIAIYDDGENFRPGPGGRGLANMHKRASRLGGHLNVGHANRETFVVLTIQRYKPEAG